jgi:hypothetical protein
MEAAGGIFMLVAVVFGIVLAICWIVLPFALIGTKPLLRQLIALQEETIKLLREANKRH